MKRPLTSYRAITFDCFGTLIDWETGILGVLRPWAAPPGTRAGHVSDDTLLAAFARAESAEQRAHPDRLYREILRGTMARIAAELGRDATDDDAGRLADSVADWPAFPDTPEALRELKRRAHLVVVSNVDRQSFEGARPRLGIPLDGLVTAEEVGAYKPDVRVFRRTLDLIAELGVKPRDHLHVAQSLHHDLIPAQALGIATCWIDRREGRPGGATPEPSRAVRPDYIFTSMRALADAVTRDAAAAARAAAEREESEEPGD